MNTSTARVQALRLQRKAEGLVRLDLYVHPDDRESIKAHAEKLAKMRRKAVK